MIKSVFKFKNWIYMYPIAFGGNYFFKLLKEISVFNIQEAMENSFLVYIIVFQTVVWASLYSGATITMSKLAPNKSLFGGSKIVLLGTVIVTVILMMDSLFGLDNLEFTVNGINPAIVLTFTAIIGIIFLFYVFHALHSRSCTHCGSFALAFDKKEIKNIYEKVITIYKDGREIPSIGVYNSICETHICQGCKSKVYFSHDERAAVKPYNGIEDIKKIEGLSQN